MRRSLVLIAALSALAAPRSAAAQQAGPDTRPGIAVFPFNYGGSFGARREDLAPLEVGIQQMLMTEFAQNPSLRIVERSRLREILDEQGLVTSGQVDPSTAARIGRLVGARYVITGGFVDNNGDFRLDGRIVDVETSEVMRAQQVRDDKDNLYPLLVELASRITARVNLPPLPSPVAQERRSRQIPPEAIALYSRAQVYQDSGRNAQAIQLYEQIAREFPAMTEAREALRQLAPGG
jgi:TolB-like protein